MRARLALAFPAVLLASCGYPGDPLPPALNIPATVTDLHAGQRGSDLVITYTAPELTTEALGITRFNGVDLRVGPIPSDFSMDAWAAGAKQISTDLPEPGKPAVVHTPAAEWTGREVMVAVRLAGAKGRLSAWSNNVPIRIIPPLRTPVVQAQPDPAGVRLTWQAQPGAQYHISRIAEGEQEPTNAGTASTGAFVDRSAVLGKTYTYTVQAAVGASESEPSAPVKVIPRDEFPPKAPANLMAAAGVNSIELTWDRNSEPDLASYRVYRATGNGEFAVLVDSVEGISLSDRQIVSATVYRYRVTAVDRSGNESLPSAIVQVTAP